jgi:CYTH domain-containing protein
MWIAKPKGSDATWPAGIRPGLAPARTPEAKPRGSEMPVEIERKFLVTHDGWRRPEPGQRYRQGYLCNGEVTVRVRRAGSRSFLTIKGTSTGLGRPEFEYEIPAEEAKELFKLCRYLLIEKVRHTIPYADLVWHVDEFAGENAGPLLAEVELRHPRQSVSCRTGSERKSRRTSVIAIPTSSMSRRVWVGLGGRRLSRTGKPSSQSVKRRRHIVLRYAAIQRPAPSSPLMERLEARATLLPRGHGRTLKRNTVTHETEVGPKERQEASGIEGKSPAPWRQDGQHASQADGQRQPERCSG